MLVGFDKWWQEEGKMIDPDTEDVPWFDKRQVLADLAFEAGIKCGMARGIVYNCGMARAANYTAVAFEAGIKCGMARGIVYNSDTECFWRLDNAR